MAEQGSTTGLGHLLVVYQGRIYFIPEDCIGSPLNCPEEDKELIHRGIDRLISEDKSKMVELAMWVDPCNMLKIMGRN
jgi:hypothetical protein